MTQMWEGPQDAKHKEEPFRSIRKVVSAAIKRAVEQSETKKRKIIKVLILLQYWKGQITSWAATFECFQLLIFVLQPAPTGSGIRVCVLYAMRQRLAPAREYVGCNKISCIAVQKSLSNGKKHTSMLDDHDVLVF